jgi:uncharacterized membrane protein
MQKFATLPRSVQSGCLFFVFSLLLLAIPSSGVKAQGNLLIAPKRIVFEGNKKTMELNLANTGRDTAKYIISMKEIRMTENGGFEEIIQPDPGQNFASKNIRIFPRNIVLAPNESQVVRVQVTKKNELTPGEYRSHIYFRATPDTRALGEANPAADTGISVQLVPVFGITVPVIIRVGESNTQVKLSNVAVNKIDDTTTRLQLTLNRTGNMSAYGDIVVEHTSPSGKVTEVGLARGVAIYTPNERRNFAFDLSRDAKVDYSKGSVRVLYVADYDRRKDKNADKNASLAYAVLVLK